MKKEGKSKLEKKVMEGIYGEPELKKEEKNRFLGQFKERVINFLTYKQVMEKGINNKILTAIKDPEAAKIVIDRDVDIDYARDYIELARENNLKFKRIDSPDFIGDIALVIVSNHAVDYKRNKMSAE